MQLQCALLAGCSAAGDRGRHYFPARRHQRLAHGSQPANGGRALATMIKWSMIAICVVTRNNKLNCLCKA